MVLDRDDTVVHFPRPAPRPMDALAEASKRIVGAGDSVCGGRLQRADAGACGLVIRALRVCMAVDGADRASRRARCTVISQASGSALGLAQPGIVRPSLIGHLGRLGEHDAKKRAAELASLVALASYRIC